MHPRGRTTISCRCFARTALAGLLAVAFAARLAGAADGFPDALRWSVPVSAPPAGAPIIVGSILIVPLQGGSLAAHRLQDGQQVWTKEVVVDRPLAGDDTRVYVASGDTIHAFDVTSGANVWSVAANGRLTAPPLARGGWVVAAAGGDLVTLRGADGAVLWRTAIGTVEFRPALDGDLLVVSTVEGRVVALDLPTGKVRWTVALGAEPAEPFVVGDRVYVGAKNKLFFTLQASDGRLRPFRKVGAEPIGRAAVDDRHVYFAAMNNLLTAIDRRNGALKWDKPLPYRPGGGPVLVGGFVMVPGYIETPIPAFDAKTGHDAGAVPFGKLLAALPAFGHLPDGTPVVVGITGGLENKWNVSMFAPLIVPVLPLQRLTSMPGELLPPPSGTD